MGTAEIVIAFGSNDTWAPRRRRRGRVEAAATGSSCWWDRCHRRCHPQTREDAAGRQRRCCGMSVPADRRGGWRSGV